MKMLFEIKKDNEHLSNLYIELKLIIHITHMCSLYQKYDNSTLLQNILSYYKNI